jgi:orotate phosphoribosyltransferase
VQTNSPDDALAQNLAELEPDEPSTAARPGGADPTSDWVRLRELIRDLAVVPGRVTLSSGREADHYIDLRRITLQAQAAPLVGRVMRDLMADWSFSSIGGLTMGADPVATAVLHAGSAGGRPIDAFVVRKQGKSHGLQRRIEGPDVAGRLVVAVEDTSTTGGSVLTAVQALREAGAEVIGVAVIVDRGTGAREVIEAAGVPYRWAYDLADLGLTP